MATLQVEKLGLAVDAGFWSKLADKKLHVWQTNMDPVPEVGFSFTPTANKEGEVRVDGNAFDPIRTGERRDCTDNEIWSRSGVMVNTNTIEEWKSGSSNLLPRAAHLLQSIQSGAFLQHTNGLLAPFFYCFANLKTYIFIHKTAFISLLPCDGEGNVIQWETEAAPANATEAGPGLGLSQEELAQVGGFYRALPRENCLAFLVSKGEEGLKSHPLSELESVREGSQGAYWMVILDTARGAYPGWILRDLLLAVTVHFKLDCDLPVLCLREAFADSVLTYSGLVMKARANYPALTKGKGAPNTSGEELGVGVKAVGWQDKPKRADLGSLMDAKQLAKNSAALNIQLMRWRMLPALDTAKLAQQKCLFLGSGTLGCNLARGCMMWGASQLKFVDYGKVSLSNPVRQSLFTFADVGKGKGEAAAEACRSILPGVESEGYTLQIPMPGHPIGADTESETNRLRELIAWADVVFLGTDSRESRWLPTLLCQMERKLTINCALGFSTYLIMRHGVPEPKSGVPAPEEATEGRAKQQLGCYYCQDIVAPRDSLSDRSLDQQCTVTRPGISAIASSYGIELWASAVQHEHGAYAATDGESVLGMVPHQLRGDVSDGSMMTLEGPAFSACTACSPKIREKAEAEGWPFLREALSNPKILEEVSGVEAMTAQAMEYDPDEEIDDDDF